MEKNMKKKILIALWVGAVGYGLYCAWHGDQFGVRASMFVVVAVVLWPRFAAKATKNAPDSDRT